MSYTEKDIYEAKQAQTRAYYIVSMAIVVGSTLCVLAFLFLNRPMSPPQPIPPPKVTAENCKSLCGEEGVEKYQVDEACFCRKPVAKDKKLNCICEPVVP